MKKKKKSKYLKITLSIFISLMLIGVILWYVGILRIWGEILYYRFIARLPTNVEFQFQDCYEQDRYYEKMDEKKWLSDSILSLKVTKSYDCDAVYYFGDYEIIDSILHLKPIAIKKNSQNICKCPVKFEYIIKGLEKREYEIKF